jgi:hypothetical protein
MPEITQKNQGTYWLALKFTNFCRYSIANVFSFVFTVSFKPSKYAFSSSSYSWKQSVLLTFSCRIHVWRAPSVFRISKAC